MHDQTVAVLSKLLGPKISVAKAKEITVVTSLVDYLVKVRRYQHCRVKGVASAEGS